MLTGIHVLLTYKCTFECDHCFLHCGSHREGTFTLRKLRDLLDEVEKIPTVDTVYFEGGEPFLFYPILLEGLRWVRDAGWHAGTVTNGYWATSMEDAEQWLQPVAKIGIADFSVSDDQFHSTKDADSPGSIASGAALKMGLPCDRICIAAPTVAAPSDSAVEKGQPVTGGGVKFRGRAAEKLTSGLPVRPWQELTTCPYEKLADPERVHVDAYGNVHLCQGISIGNMWSTPLSKLLHDYQAEKHPVAGPLLQGGPAQLARQYGIGPAEGYVDECHLCYMLRKSLLPVFPQYLAPAQVYGM
ncbi:MAG: radical SAM protein [Acidobacteriota bacterium]|nr:radical SAM protein [Acidobacteriota bacterium]